MGLTEKQKEQIKQIKEINDYVGALAVHEKMNLEIVADMTLDKIANLAGEATSEKAVKFFEVAAFLHGFRKS